MLNRTCSINSITKTNMFLSQRATYRGMINREMRGKHGKGEKKIGED